MRGLTTHVALGLFVLSVAVGCSGAFEDPLAGAHQPGTPEEKRVVATVTKALQLADDADPIVCTYYSTAFKRAVVEQTRAQLRPSAVRRFERDTGHPFGCLGAFALAEADETTPAPFDDYLVVGDLPADRVEVLGVIGAGEPRPQWMLVALRRNAASPTGWVIDDFQPDRDNNLNTAG